MWHSIRNTVRVCVFMSMCVGGDWQFQQMCSVLWQHDIYFACSIWHVWMLPCILSWCEVIARDVQPRWNHSLLSLLQQQYQNVSLINSKTGALKYIVSYFVSIFIFWFKVPRLTVRAEQTNNVYLNLTLWHIPQYSITEKYALLLQYL